MDNQFQSSFIPKKPIIGADVASPHTSINFFAIIGLVLFILSIVAAAGSFAWVKILQRQEVTNKASLDATRASFNPEVIERIKKVSERINSAKEILNNHISLSAFFDLIQNNTLKSVRFTGLSYDYSDNKVVKVTLNGEADSFTSVALQSDIFGANKLITNPIITNLSLLENGHVSFQFSGGIVPTVFNFKAAQVRATSTPAVDVTAASSSPTGGESNIQQ